jgi:hypothetical protein
MVNRIVRLWIRNVFHVPIVAPINPHKTLDPPLAFPVVLIRDFLF